MAYGNWGIKGFPIGSNTTRSLGLAFSCYAHYLHFLHFLCDFGALFSSFFSLFFFGTFCTFYALFEIFLKKQEEEKYIYIDIFCAYQFVFYFVLVFC